MVYVFHIPKAGIAVVDTAHIERKERFKVANPSSHTQYIQNSLKLLHQMVLSPLWTLLQRREVWAKRKQQWKYTGIEYRTQTYKILIKK